MVKVTQYAIEGCRRCNCDHVAFYDGTTADEDNMIGSLCGTWGGDVIVSNTPYLLIVFKSDDATNNAGFTLHWTDVVATNPGKINHCYLY